MKVLLVANYLPDAQQSMQRFAAMLERELPEYGVEVEVLRPAPRVNLRAGRRGIDKYLGYVDKMFLFTRSLARRLEQRPRDTVVHICDHSNAFYTAALKGVPHLITCHDLLAVRSALGEFGRNTTGWSGRRLQSIIVDGLNRAQRVVCVSDATRTDLLRLTTLDPHQVEVIYNGLNYFYQPMDPSVAGLHLRSRGIRPPFILHVGGDHWYKNRTGVLEIYKALGPGRPPLVIAGEPLSPAHSRWLEQHRLDGDVKVITAASNEELCALYSLASLLLFPSVIEGFGWPIAEAQACGCPVVTTFRAPMTEVGGQAAIYINPDEPTHAADLVNAILHEPPSIRLKRRAESIANADRFASDLMVEGYLGAYHSLLGHKPLRQQAVLS